MYAVSASSNVTGSVDTGAGEVSTLAGNTTVDGGVTVATCSLLGVGTEARPSVFVDVPLPPIFSPQPNASMATDSIVPNASAVILSPL
jgi:hypothetical protein